MINEGANGKSLRELRDAPNMVPMKMSDENVIDLAKTGGFRGRDDTLGVAAVEPWPARVHEHRLPTRSHKQGSLTTLHIDEVDL
jgi:hypothetical protein